MGGGLVEETFDDNGDVINVGDYTFAKGTLGKGSFASVRLAHRPSRLEKPVRLALADNDKTAKEVAKSVDDSTIQLYANDDDSVYGDGDGDDQLRQSNISNNGTSSTGKGILGRSSNGGMKLTRRVSKRLGGAANRLGLMRRSKSKRDKSSNSNSNNGGDTASMEGSRHSTGSSESSKRPTPMLVNETKTKEYWLRRLSRTKSQLEMSVSDVEGRFGTAPSLEDCTEAEFVAVKVFNKSLLKKMRTMTRDAASRKMKVKTGLDRVEYEIALMKKLRHPNLLMLHEVMDSENSDHLYVILEYCPLGEIMSFNEDTQRYERSEFAKVATYCHVCGLTKGRLRKICCVEKHFDEAHSAGYMVDILLGLAYLHRHKICHRDLKPENILLDCNGHCKIADFGMSHIFENEVIPEEQEAHKEFDEKAAAVVEDSCDRIAQDEFRRADSHMAKNMRKMADQGLLTKTEGTWCFYAPEMCSQGEPFSAYAADLWAAGICLYIFATGEIPFYSPDPSELFDKIVQDDIVYPDCLSLDCKDILQQMLNKNFKVRAGVGDCLNHRFVLEKKVQRSRSLNSVFSFVEQSVAPTDEEVKDAITKITFGTAAFVLTASAKLKRFRSRRSNPLAGSSSAAGAFAAAAARKSTPELNGK